MGLDPRPPGVGKCDGETGNMEGVVRELLGLNGARETTPPRQNASALIYLFEVAY